MQNVGVDPQYPNYCDPADYALEHIRLHAESVLKVAAELGVVLTIEQRPRQPLAMGNYEHVVSVRPARIQAKDQQ